MLGKQWLNRYASIEMRGSAIERSQNRQRKLDGIVTWYFNYVMESLPLMLQFALLLLGCALSRYLWEINTTVASVVLGVTSFGVVSYAFFVVAGAASGSCPYQTPGTHILRHVSALTLNALRSAYSHSMVVEAFDMGYLVVSDFECSIGNVVLLALVPLLLLVTLVFDIFVLARVVARAFVANARRLCGWFRRGCRRDRQTTTLDLRCILWMLQTSLDKSIRLSTLRSLATMTTLINLDPILVSTCFNILAGCVSIIGGKVVILQGSEEFATVSSLFCLRALCHLATADQTSSTSKDVRRLYTKAFPGETDFEGFPSYHRFCVIRNFFYPSSRFFRGKEFPVAVRPKIQWRGYKLSSTEHTVLIQLAQFEYQRRRLQKVPRWILYYGFHILSQDPLPPASVIADCVSIIAMELGCAVPNTTTLNERYVYI